MIAQANSHSAHSDGPISYDTQHEATLPSGIQAGPVSKQLWYTDHYNAVASALAGFPIEADGEDDYAEWGSWLDDPYAVLGFTSIYASASSPLYHRIFLAPPIWSTLLQIDSGGIDSVSRADAAEAILTLTHEAYHQRLYSSDESRVNACALRDFGWVLVNEFGVSPDDSADRDFAEDLIRPRTPCCLADQQGQARAAVRVPACSEDDLHEPHPDGP